MLNADLALYRQANFGAALTLDVRKLTQTWDTTTTWLNRTATTAWSTAGGTVDGTVYDSTAVGTAAGYYHWYPTSLVQAWVNDPVTNNGLLLKAANKATAALARFEPASTTTGNPPQLAVTWSPVVGEQPYYSYTEHRLNDRFHLHINNGSGDLLVHASDPVSGGWRGNGVNGLLTGPDAGGDYTLTFDKSQERYLFDNFGCTNGCGYLQTRDTDRNGNSLRYHGRGGLPVRLRLQRSLRCAVRQRPPGCLRAPPPAPTWSTSATRRAAPRPTATTGPTG